MRILLPQTVRMRLTLMYAALFLAAGTVLLAVSYGLLAASLPVRTPGSKVNPALAKLQQTCKAESGPLATATPKPGPATPKPGPATPSPGLAIRSPGPATAGTVSKAQCEHAFAAAAAAGATDQRAATLNRLLIFSLAGLGLMTVASGGIGWLMAGRALRPVSSITAAARRASERHLGERLALQGPRDELKELADTFDQMLERLDAAFATQRRFVADASHELRTPLTVMRTAIEVTMAKPARTPEQLEAMAAKVARSASQAEALFEALLTLATSEQPLPSVEPADLATAAEDSIEAAGPRIRRLGLRVETVLEPAPVTGNRLLLDRMIGNLTDNAVRYNTSGGWLRVETGTSGGRAAVTVANSGPVVPEELVPTLFEPFRRVAGRTGVQDGAGLGLAIVRSIAAAHAGEVTAQAIGTGGLVVTVTLPGLPGEAAGPGNESGPCGAAAFGRRLEYAGEPERMENLQSGAQPRTPEAGRRAARASGHDNLPAGE